jgi:PKD repeat protein
MRSTSNQNHPPVANFKYKPSYLNPTDQQTIQFTNLSTDLDGDPLAYKWLVDGQLASEEKDYSAKLPVGPHTVELEASDPQIKTATTQAVTVEPDQIYPTKQLHIGYKGMRMMVGWKGMAWPIPIDITDEKLDIIHDELGCNAVLIFGNTEFEDDLIEAGRLAIRKGFDRIYVAPVYLDLPIDQTVQNIGRFAKKIRVLREASDSVVFMIGHEFTFDAYGIVPGETYPDRLWYPIQKPDWVRNSYWKVLNSTLPDAFRRIIALCRENYGYQIAYAATPDEAASIVPWSDPIFESVSSDAYIWENVGWTENWIVNHLSELKRFRKPVNSTEWGCMTYKRASQEWYHDAPEDLAKYPYDEDEQTKYIAQYCNTLNRARISGAFCNQLDDERLRGYGL